MTKISDIPGYSESAPKKKERNPHLSIGQDGFNKGHNACHDAFSELTVQVDEEALAIFINCLPDDFIKIDYGYSDDPQMNISIDEDKLAKSIATNLQKFLRIGK